MEMKLKTKSKKVIFFIIANVLLLIILYNIPLETRFSLCLYKLLINKECWNCGMTRAFLSILHFQFEAALRYNSKVIVVFPLAAYLYIYAWIKYIKKG
jgi:hypothetical protein